MSWIRTILPERASGALQTLYERIASPQGKVDNVMVAHSLRPHTLYGHMTLYKAVLHHPRNSLPAWFLELVGVRVSYQNRCAYCVAHHSAGLRGLLDNDARHAALLEAIGVGDAGGAAPRDASQPPAAPNAAALAEHGLSAAMIALLDYADTLTVAPSTLTKARVAQLRAAGADDGEVLEVNQVAAYFAYVNRTVLGLGVQLDGDTLGLFPSSDDADTWADRPA